MTVSDLNLPAVPGSPSSREEVSTLEGVAVARRPNIQSAKRPFAILTIDEAVDELTAYFHSSARGRMKESLLVNGHACTMREDYYLVSPGGRPCVYRPSQTKAA
jgi:hypothetical protein